MALSDDVTFLKAADYIVVVEEERYSKNEWELSVGT